MRTVAHKQKPTQQTKSSNPKRPGRAFSSQSREVRSVLHSQCTIGNHAVQRLPQSSAKELHAESATPASTRFSHDFSRIPIFSPSSVQVQPKLMVNTPGDIYEQEADRVAEHVMRIPDSTVLQQPQGNHQSQKETLTHHNTPVIQRQSETEDEEEVVLQDANSEAGESDNVESISPIIDSVATTDAIALEDEEEPEGDLIQRKQRTEDSNPENTITISPHKVINGGGQPLPAAERDFFEPRFGADFSHIRIHTGQQAARTSDSLNAQAFTLGRNIAFAEGKFSPGSFSHFNFILEYRQIY